MRATISQVRSQTARYRKNTGTYGTEKDRCGSELAEMCTCGEAAVFMLALAFALSPHIIINGSTKSSFRL